MFWGHIAIFVFVQNEYDLNMHFVTGSISKLINYQKLNRNLP